MYLKDVEEYLPKKPKEGINIAKNLGGGGCEEKRDILCRRDRV